ncbi:hypothetical protein ACHAXR_001107 [Thalassiosira sp. AJA248-18]
MNSTFPYSKIKSQILRDEGVGRLSSKAVELIATCSALFVRDLVDNYCDDASDKQNNNSRKRKSAAGTNTNCIPDDENIIKASHIKKQAKKRPEYGFLNDGTSLDELTEKNAPKYDATRRRKRQKENSKGQKDNPDQSCDSIFKSLPDDAIDGTKNSVVVGGSGGGQQDSEALQEAIEDAQEIASASRGSGLKEIIEDNDDYD